MWRAKRWEDLEKYFTSGDVFTDTTYPQTTRYEKTYPPRAWLDELYVKTVKKEDNLETFHDAVVLANDGPAWTAWHVDRKPPLSVYCQLYSGWKIFMILKPGEMQRLLFRPKWKWSPDSFKNYIEKSGGWVKGMRIHKLLPGETLFMPAGTAHAVLSDKGFTNMLTYQHKVSVELEEEQGRQVDNGSGEPGARHDSAGLRKRKRPQNKSKLGQKRKQRKHKTSDSE